MSELNVQVVSCRRDLLSPELNPLIAGEYTCQIRLLKGVLLFTYNAESGLAPKPIW